MQNPNPLTPQHPSENECFASDAVEDAEETGALPSSVFIGGRPLCNLRLADDIDLLGGSEKELQLTERVDTIAASYNKDIDSNKANFLSTASSQDHKTIYQLMDEWKKAGRS